MAKMKNQLAITNLEGAARRVQLIVCEPHPADQFITEEDALVLLLRFTITKEERRSHQAYRKLRKLDPKLSFSKKLVNVTHRMTIADGYHWYVVEYHIADYDYGVGIYNELVYKFFKS